MRSLLVAALVSAAALVPLGLARSGPVGPGAPSPGRLAPVAVRHQPPVEGTVVDVFRQPPSPFGPGNRGIDYATLPGTVVRASADGEVVFAAAVGGRLHVVVRHGDGLRTSYSFLAAVSVSRGDRVTVGQEVGRAGSTVHFGARRGDAYIDPLTLFSAPGQARVHLVPDEPAGRGQPLAGPAPRTPVDSSALRWARRPAGGSVPGR
ncbi:MAG: M23 family metallopeptidase [Actinomycetota bacterium]|nr:M23 family metallopeptidase [Actinomycetota bacterium]